MRWSALEAKFTNSKFSLDFFFHEPKLLMLRKKFCLNPAAPAAAQHSERSRQEDEVT